MGPVTCASCAAENPPGARFCMACGAPFERVCPGCGVAAPPQARFCMQCGTELVGEAAPAAAATPVPPSAPVAVPPEERRQVTVLFADLSGYTAVSERMDPERVKVLVDDVLRRLGQEVQRYGGTVDKYMGDSVMALFGAPVAHEDDAERAVRAGLGMQAAMLELNGRLAESHGVTFSLRVGVNTGEVVAGAVGDAYTVVGDAVNVAARLQAAGAPGGVTVGQRTMRATEHAIAYRQLEPLTLRGKDEPVPAWEAVEALAAQPRRRATDARSPLVGREHELELLASLADRVAGERRPHLVTVVGEPGVGKSRLMLELRRRLGAAEERPTFLVGHCPPYGAAIVYWALGEVLRVEVGITDEDSAQQAWRKLTAGVEERVHAAGVPSAEAGRHAAVIGRSLGLGPTESPVPAVEDPQRVRESFFAAVRVLVEAMAAERPVVLAFEDVHWADEGMLDLVEYLAQWVRAPVLLLCLTRDELFERRESWGGGRRNVTTLGLEPLSAEETRALVRSLLPEADRERAAALVAERAEGNPLFAEELVQHVTEGDDRGLPDTVQGVLAARLDALPRSERQVVQHAAVVGRTFWPGALERMSRDVTGDLDAALRALEEKQLVMRSHTRPRLGEEQELTFKHVLIRDVAYGVLPKAVRARLHLEVARYVAERSGDRADEMVGLLAEHYGRAAALARETGLDGELRAELEGEALAALEAAGDAAAALYSNAEAYDHYAAACALEPSDDELRARLREKQGDVALLMGRVDAAIADWEECLEHHQAADRADRVADLHRKIGMALWQKGAVKGAIERYQEGIGLLKDTEPTHALVRLYEEAATLYMHSGDNMLAIYAAEKALRVAEKLGEPGAASRAHEVFGRVFGRMGDGVRARENLERSVELARASGPNDTIRGLIALGSHLDLAEADYAGAERAYLEALDVARRVGDLTGEAELGSALALLAAYRADWDAVASRAAAGRALAEREGLARGLAYPYAFEGLLHWREGKFPAAEEAYRRALALAEETGSSEAAFWSLYGLAITLRDAGDIDGALDALDRSLDICERAGLVAQSAQSTAARAMNLWLSGEAEKARTAAATAAGAAERLPYPAVRAAALQASGAVGADADTLASARACWEALARPLDVAWCDVLMAQLLGAKRPEAARQARDRAAAAFTALEVPHLAEWVRSFVAIA